MFLITNLQHHVIIGPRPDWHQKLFQHAVDEEFENGDIPHAVTIPGAAPTSNTTLNNSVIVYHVTDIGITGDYNPKIQKLDGPYFTFTDIATSNLIAVNKDIVQVRHELKEIAANTRWIREIKGTTITLQGSTVSLDTNRGSRDIFLQAYQLGSNGAVWKFPSCWLTLSNAELGLIVEAVMGHVQTCFVWESTIDAEIDAATTLTALDKIVVVDPI